MKRHNNNGISFDYESDWRQYVFPGSESEFASTDEIKSRFTPVKMGTGMPHEAGLPVLSDGDVAYVNSALEHTIIFGETGCGKSWSYIKPLIPLLAESQSMFVMDVKGELSSDPRIRGYLEAMGSKCVFLDFRNFDKDGYNILQFPFELYLKGKKDEAMAAATSFIRSLSSPFQNSRADPYWHLSAEEYMLPVLQIIMEVCASRNDYHKHVNMLTMAAFCNENATNILKNILKSHITVTNNATEMLKGVLAAPDRTLSCIMSTVTSFLRDFVSHESLLRMLSNSTFEVTSMFEQKTCVFLIVPDENTTFQGITSILINDFYNRLVEHYSVHYQHEKPRYPISWVIDEFANVKINDMAAKISASRGRQMRWFLVCQSKQQLEDCYEKDARTIIGNCKNIVFLQSSDVDMLQYVSNLLGTTRITASGNPEPLMTAEQLRKLPWTADYRQAVYIRGDFKCRVNMPGFDKYRCYDRYASEDVEIPQVKMPALSAYTPQMLIADLVDGEVPCPFTRKHIRPASSAKHGRKANTSPGEFFDAS